MLIETFYMAPVDAVRVTKTNMAEVAAWCGGEVQTLESNTHPGQLVEYVLVPSKNKTRFRTHAFPGMYISRRFVALPNQKKRATYAVFKQDYFEKNFTSGKLVSFSESSFTKPEVDYLVRHLEKLGVLKGVSPTIDPVEPEEEPVGETPELPNNMVVVNTSPAPKPTAVSEALARAAEIKKQRTGSDN
ncbi:hypothetical protein EKK58_11815 [Candidatus Dependentiae bacterium]|nr:MAG: hypothetical protein EKK58_11815 [Candidatus Dependentiae bacterium]